MSEILIFDRALKRKQRARATPETTDYLFIEAAERLSDRLEGINREFPIAVDVNARGPWMSDLVKRYPSVKNIYDGFVCDEEFLPLKTGSVNLITSLLNLHWVNDLPGALIQIRQALAPDGLFLGSMLGGMTLHELRQSQVEAESELYGGISPRVSPFTDVREMAGLLQRAQFSLPVADTETITVYYPDALALMEDLKAMGETNALLKRPKNLAGKRFFKTMVEKYHQRFGTEEGVPATFEIITVTGWAEER